jgi:hypothetical protein
LREPDYQQLRELKETDGKTEHRVQQAEARLKEEQRKAQKAVEQEKVKMQAGKLYREKEVAGRDRKEPRRSLVSAT